MAAHISSTVFGRTLRYRPISVTTPDGVAIAAQDWGREGSGRDVLMIHGFSQSHLCWLRQTDSSLADEFRLATYDNRGHGMSEKPADPGFYRDGKHWAGEVDAVIRGLGLDRPVLLAWSYAGRIALDYLTEYGDGAISGLVMVCATSATGEGMAGPAAPLLRQMADAELGPSIEATRQFVNACFSSPPSAEDLQFMLSFSSVTPSAVRAALAGRPADYAATLQALRVPTLVIHGAEDQVVAPAAGSVPGARLLSYEGIGHAPFWEDAGRFNADVTAFIRSLP